MKRQGFVLFLAAAALLGLLGAVWAASTPRQGPGAGTTGGLGRMANDEYILDSTLGQVGPGHSANDEIQLDAGFWLPGTPGKLPTPTPSVTATATPTATATMTPTITLTPSATPTPGPLYLPLVVRNHPPPPPTPTPTHTPTATPTPRPLTGHETCPGELLNNAWDLIAQDFGHEDDKDWFSFYAVAGATYRIETMGLEARADTSLDLYADDCTTPLAHSDDIDYPRNIASRITWVAPAAGRYQIVVYQYDWRVYGEQTGYALLIERTK